MARTLIIPDIHENIPRLLKLEDRIAKADHVVCVGDYFDCFGHVRSFVLLGGKSQRMDVKAA